MNWNYWLILIKGVVNILMLMIGGFFYATPFTAHFLKTKLTDFGLQDKVKIKVVTQNRAKFKIADFNRYIKMLITLQIQLIKISGQKNQVKFFRNKSKEKKLNQIDLCIYIYINFICFKQ